MITCKRHHLESRCRERGYALDDIRACIVSEDGDLLVVDEKHADYPRAHRTATVPAAAPPPPPPQPASGPGTELKALLKDWLGITASPNCSCNARARTMDEWGPDVCEQKLPEIVGWLEEQANARRLPFVRFAAEQAVKLAIRRARRAAAR